MKGIVEREELDDWRISKQRNGMLKILVVYVPSSIPIICETTHDCAELDSYYRATCLIPSGGEIFSQYMQSMSTIHMRNSDSYNYIGNCGLESQTWLQNVFC